MNLLDEFSKGYADFLDDTYDCVDRLVLNAYFPMAGSGGGFRTWWRQIFGGDEQLDNTHLMRFAGRFSRRVRAYAEKENIPLIDCQRGQRKHEAAEPFIPKLPGFRGVFCILTGMAPAPVRNVLHAKNGQPHIFVPKPYRYVKHYFFHIMDPDWGHVIIRFCPHPPFPAQIILNAHEYVAIEAQKKGIDFVKEGNCFTQFSDAAGLANVTDAMSAPSAVGCLVKVCERWIYSACLCFALTTEEQERSRFRYSFSVYQLEYSRNLLFTRGRHMEQIFDSVIDHTRAALDIKTLKTIFGFKHRPFIQKKNTGKQPRFEAQIERPVWDLTVFKVHFKRLTAKIYSKGERVLRIECIAHNTQDLRCGRVIDKFPDMVQALHAMVDRFLDVLRCVDAAFIHDDFLNQLHMPSVLSGRRVAGIDTNSLRIRAIMTALVALASAPKGFTSSQLAAKVNEISRDKAASYTSRQAAYDLKKFRAKGIVKKEPYKRQYELAPQGLRSIAALHILRDKVIEPLLAGQCLPKRGRKPKNICPLDEHYKILQTEMQQLFAAIGIAA